MIEFIKANIAWIKDVVMLFFAGTGTIITILTYRRARATILQPIRNEVIKKQSELLCEVLNLCQPTNKIDNSLDYIKLVHMNVIFYLRDYGFIFRDQTELFERFNKDAVGWLYCGEAQVLEDIEVINCFVKDRSNIIDQIDASEIRKNKYEEAKKGIINIDKIYLTDSYKEYMEKLHLLSINSFMPMAIQAVLCQLILDINNNLRFALKNVIKDFLHEFFEKHSESKGYPEFNPIGVYNTFNHQRIHHTKIVYRLLKETRNYLRIDESWE